MQFTGPGKNELARFNPDGTAILIGYRGSIAHGLWEDPNSEFSTDDIDLMGVCTGTPEYYFGLKSFMGKRQVHETAFYQWDYVGYELRKFTRLLAKSNPNVTSLLWMEQHMYVSVNKSGQLLIDNRELFSSKLAYKSFVGYANNQIYRMTHNACEGYMGEKRKKIVERFGFDTKNAAHAIRLLRMGIEFLNEGRMHVHRHDRHQLLEIKHGEWTLNRVKTEADKLTALALEAVTRSSLPSEPDYDKINELLIDILTSELGM